MQHTELLQRLGLDAKQSAIYLALLTHGQSSISDIARRTGLHRPAIYQTLPTMVERGLVEQSARGRQRRYVAIPPERLEEMIEQTHAALKVALPELHALARGVSTQPAVRYLTGKRGIRSVFADLLRKSRPGDVFYRYSSPKDLARADTYLPENYRQERDRKRLERFVITSPAVARGKRPRPERMVKVIPQDSDLFAYDVTQLIYRDTVAFIDYATETAFILESPTIARFQQGVFKTLFQRLA